MRIYLIGPIILAVSSLLFTSCEKVIQLDLGTFSQLVIQGTINDQAGPYKVEISKTKSLDDETSGYQTISGALVIISDNVGNVDTLNESSSGTYVSSSLQGVPGRSYFLKVITEEQTYTATSTMPSAVEIESIDFTTGSLGNNKMVTIGFKDPADETNHYRLVEFINGLEQQSFNVASDRLNDGKEITYSLMSQGIGNEIESGDRITVWLESIDEKVFEYFREAGREGGQSASPANPTSNISNGVLGYFSACSIRKMSAIVP